MASRWVQELLDEVDTVMYDPPVSRCEQTHLSSECRDWNSAFPHIRYVVFINDLVIKYVGGLYDSTRYKSMFYLLSYLLIYICFAHHFLQPVLWKTEGVFLCCCLAK